MYIMTQISVQKAAELKCGTMGISKIDTAEQLTAAVAELVRCGLESAPILDGGPPSRAKVVGTLCADGRKVML